LHLVRVGAGAGARVGVRVARLVGEDESVAKNAIANGLDKLVALNEFGRGPTRRPREPREAELLRRRAESVGVGLERLASLGHDFEHPHARVVHLLLDRRPT